MDDNKLIKISKKYTSRSFKSWKTPPKHIVNSLNKILRMNKTKALQMSSNSKKNSNLIQQDIDINEFIKLFLKQLKTTKLPQSNQHHQQTELDYDHDYQLKKEKFLTNLYSNELNQIEKLKITLKQENEKNKSLTKFVTNYEKLYKEELKKSEAMQNLPTIKNKINTSDFQTIKLDTENSQDLKDVLNRLETQLNKIDDHTKHFQELSTEIDHLLNQI